MNQVVLDIPGETLLALKVPVTEIGETLRMVAAVKLFELGRLSSGAAARLAGVPRFFSFPVGRLWGGYISLDRGATFEGNAPCLRSSATRHPFNILKLLYILPALAQRVIVPLWGL